MYKFKYFIRLFLFWLLYFLVNRLIFFIIYYQEFVNVNLFELLNILPKSISLDISFIAYLSVIIFLLLFFNTFCLIKSINVFISNIILIINKIFIVLTGLVYVGEVCLYKEWGAKLNSTALSHFKQASEVFMTASLFDYYVLLFYIGVMYLFIVIYKSKVHVKFISNKRNFYVSLNILSLPFWLGLFLLLIRGGFQAIPINVSDAYFSKNLIVNDVTVNSNWNLIQSILKSKRSIKGNPYHKYSNQKYQDFIINFKTDYNDTNTYVLNKSEPNIVFIILESWSADNIESLGGLQGITPNFAELEKKGILFSNFYSNGYKSEQAMSSIFSSFPVFPYISIIKETDKSRKLPCLNKSLSNYHSSFLFGGQLSYGNIKGFLLNQGFDVVKDGLVFDDLPQGRLGVHDEYMFPEFQHHLNNLKEPFLSTLFTISSHSPYDFPADHKLSFNSRYDEYVNSVAYTDSCLGYFFNNIKSESWYSNTLFIIVADHSHNTPMNRRVAQKEKFQIPMLWFGDVIKDEYKGSSCNDVSSHIDIAPTILMQLDLNIDERYFGKNIFNPNVKKFAPYSFIRGYGMIRDSSYYAYSIPYNKILEYSSYKDSLIIQDTEMFMQYSFNEYMNY